MKVNWVYSLGEAQYNEWAYRECGDWVGKDNEETASHFLVTGDQQKSPTVETMRLSLVTLVSTIRLRLCFPHLARLHEVLRGEFQLTLGLTLRFLFQE